MRLLIWNITAFGLLDWGKPFKDLTTFHTSASDEITSDSSNQRQTKYPWKFARYHIQWKLLEQQINWTGDEPIGSSDNNPIIIEISVKIRHVFLLNRAAKWKLKDANWQEFKEEVIEKNILDTEAVRLLLIKSLIEKFSKALLWCYYCKSGENKTWSEQQKKRLTEKSR